MVNRSVNGPAKSARPGKGGSPQAAAESQLGNNLQSFQSVRPLSFRWHAFRRGVAGPNLLGSKMTRTLSNRCRGSADVDWLADAGAGATSRIKDLANIEGVRQNQLIGYGLVVGLNGTGDTLNNIPFTKQSLQAMLERLGVNIRGAADPHRQRRRRDGDRQPAGVRHPGHAHRRHRVGARRLQEPAGRHAAGHAAARRRRQRLRGRRRARSRSPASRPKAKPPRSCAAFRPSAASPTAPSSSARSSSR